jgi:hypothetical protein
MPYRIASTDVHKGMLAVVDSEVEVVEEYQFERRQFGMNSAQLRQLAARLLEQQLEKVVMESTAQYWKPDWAGAVLEAGIPAALSRQPLASSSCNKVCME